MQRQKLVVHDVGLRLDDQGKLAFCKENDAFALTNLSFEFDAEYQGSEEDGSDCFEITPVNTAWFYHGEDDNQHFTGTANSKPENNPLHAAAVAYITQYCWDDVLEMTRNAYDGERECAREIARAA